MNFSLYRPELPEVVVESSALVEFPEYRLHLHPDLDLLGVNVRHLSVEPSAAFQVNRDHGRGRVRVGDQGVQGKGIDLSAAGELLGPHVLAPALPALIPGRILDGAA